MKKARILFGALMCLILASACGNNTKTTDQQNNSEGLSTDTTMQTDSTIQDTSTIQYRDSNSTEPSGAIPPTSK